MRVSTYQRNLILLLLLLLVQSIHARDYFDSKFTKTVRQKRYYELISEKQIAFVCFWARECRDCDRLGPPWIEVAEMFTSENVVFFQVNILPLKPCILVFT